MNRFGITSRDEWLANLRLALAVSSILIGGLFYLLLAQAQYG